MVIARLHAKQCDNDGETHMMTRITGTVYYDGNAAELRGTTKSVLGEPNPKSHRLTPQAPESASFTITSDVDGGILSWKAQGGADAIIVRDLEEGFRVDVTAADASDTRRKTSDKGASKAPKR